LHTLTLLELKRRRREADTPAVSASTRLGGQAVIEGVMVRYGPRWAVAARRPDGTIATHRAAVPAWAGALRKVPVVRGTVALASTIGLGMQALSWSRSVADGDKPQSRGSVAAATTLSVVVFVTIFALAPAAVARLVAEDGWLFAVTEAVVRLALFVGYIAAIGRLPGIRRTFEYHGAEHQAIAAAEAGMRGPNAMVGDALTVEHVRTYSPRHARCGTDFMVLVAVVAVFAFALVAPHSWLLLAVSRVLLLPVVAGLAYEILRVSDRPGVSRWLKPVMVPAMAVQRLTTRTPTDDQVEVAIVAVQTALAGTNAEAPAP